MDYGHNENSCCSNKKKQGMCDLGEEGYQTKLSIQRDTGKKKWISNRRGVKLSDRKSNEMDVDSLRHYSLNTISGF